MTGQPTPNSGAANRQNKIVSAAEAVSVIKNGSMIATGGFVGTGFAEHLAVALEKRFLETGEPSNLGFVYAAGQGDGKSRGLNHFIHHSMVGIVVGGHWGLVPGLQKQAMENKISAYNLPQGIISTMFRDIAAKKPRTISAVGLGTYVDPRNDGQLLFYDQVIPGATLLGYANTDHWGVALPLEFKHSWLALRPGYVPPFPRTALLEAILLYIAEDLRRIDRATEAAL